MVAKVEDRFQQTLQFPFWQSLFSEGGFCKLLCIHLACLRNEAKDVQILWGLDLFSFKGKRKQKFMHRISEVSGTQCFDVSMTSF